MPRDWLGKRALIFAFVVCALPLCIITALITPPGQSPDEPAHVARAEGLLRGYVMGTRVRFVDPKTLKTEMVGGVRAAPDVFIEAFSVDTMVPGRRTPLFTSANMAQMEAERRDQKPFDISITNTIMYFPAAYVPAAIGIAIGRATRARPFECLILARLTAGLAFVGLGALALGLAAYGEALLLAVLLMPMTLFLAATENPDGMLIAMVCLACALLTRGSRVAGLVVMALVLGAKVPYALLLGVFLLPLGDPGLWRRMRHIAITLAPVVLWVILVVVFVGGPIPRPPYHPGPLFPGDRSIWMDHTAAAVNLRILLHSPSLLLTLPIDTLREQYRLYLAEMIGVLANLSITLPMKYYVAWAGALVCALAGVLVTPRKGASLADCAFVWMLLVATVWGLMISFYPLWSNAGLDFIDGPQGRYFILLLPFLLFAVPSWRGGWRVPPALPALPAIALGVFDLGFLPVKLAWSFYLH
jgi:hypothetical protein